MPKHADTAQTRRARYFSDGNGFTSRWPDVPARQFLPERERAFDPVAPTALIALDCSDTLQTGYPATTPVLLLRYAKLRASETLRTDFVASGEIYYVIRSSGESSNAGETIAWEPGDMFLFPGGAQTLHRAGSDDCLLYIGTDEPLLAYAALRAPASGTAKVAATHWPYFTLEKSMRGEHGASRLGLIDGRLAARTGRLPIRRRHAASDQHHPTMPLARVP